MNNHSLIKRLGLLLLAVLPTVFAEAQKPNTFIRASIPGIPASDWVYYQSFNSDIRDSVKPDAKGFDIDLHIAEGEGDLFFLSIGKLTAQSVQGQSVLMYFEKGSTKIEAKSGNFKDAKYSGGNAAKFYNEFQKREKVAELETANLALSNAYRDQDTAQMRILRVKSQELQKQQTALDKKWLLANRTSPAIVYPLFFSLQGELSYTGLDSLLQQTTPEARNNLVVKKIEYSIKTDKLTGIGRPALEFSQTDTAGKMVELSDFRGKYVLVDFWASWCVPCRVENPHVVAAFQQYKNKNFTVLGVSFDRPGMHDKWVKAIHDDNLGWNHVSDLKFWNNAAGKLYDIHSIPSNVLIDPKGIIVDKNLRGDELDKKLHELVGEPAMDKGTYVLKGQMKNAEPGTWFHLSYMGVGNKRVTDSVKLFSGVFSMIGKTEYPQQVYAYFKQEGANQATAPVSYLSFFIEPGVISLAGDAAKPEDIAVSGSETQREYEEFRQQTKDLTESVKPLNERYNTLNLQYIKLRREGKTEDELAKMKEQLEAIRDSMGPYQDQMKNRNMAFFKAHPNSFVTVSQLKFYVSSMSAAELEAIYAQMDVALKETPDGKELADEIASLRSGSPGSVATNFKGTDINGVPLQLTDYKGKYVLLDFWASWCGPCRKGNPHLLKLYSQYKKKGFEIIGVSDDDRNNEAWKKAVEKDGIGVWKHVLRGLKSGPDGFDRSEDKSEAYGIHSLPTKILIDRDGMIIGRYGGGGEDDEALDKKLTEVFSK